MNSDNITTTRLRQLRHYLDEKNRRLDALLQLFRQTPSLPIEAMVREYSTVLDATDGHEYLEQVQQDASTEGLGYRQRSARTKRIRTRERLISTTQGLVIRREPFRLQDVADLAGVGVATLYSHFKTKNDLLWAVYDSLVQPILRPHR